MKITKIRHCGILIETNSYTVYIDPYLDPFIHADLPKADLILISNTRYDHATQESVNLIRDTDTKVYGPLEAKDDIDLTAVASGTTLERTGLRFTAAEVTNPDVKSFAYLLETDTQFILYTGDTNELSALHGDPCTILISPITNGLTRDDDLIRLINETKPRIFIPVHYGTLSGTRDDALAIKARIDAETSTITHVLDDGESLDI